VVEFTDPQFCFFVFFGKWLGNAGGDIIEADSILTFAKIWMSELFNPFGVGGIFTLSCSEGRRLLAPTLG
jgi:hypothetical protein